jgi:hypothetical protein
MNTLAALLILAATVVAFYLTLPIFEADAHRDAAREREEAERWLRKYNRELAN